MSFRGRDIADGGNANKMELGETRRFPSGNMDDKGLGDDDDRRFDSGRGRRPPFGRGRRPSPPGRADRPRDFGYGRDDPSPMRDRSPMRPPDDRFADRYKKDDGAFPKRDDIGRKDIGRSFYGDDPPRDRFMEGGRSRFDGPGNFNSRFDGPADSYKSRSMSYPSAANAAPPPRSFASEGFPKPNECEIIAVSKHQRAYAESVEARIKNIGILVDVLFLKDEALLTQTIDDIARRGSLFAMVISPQNETHGSVTVNILHGTPQEHRNMPLEDALKLVSRNFHEHIRAQKENMERERAERGPYVGGVAADREIQFLLRMLADGRWISLAEINDIIRYLSERRDKMKATPGGDRMLSRAPIPPADVKLDVPYKPKDDLDVSKKEQDLQNRIINLMNQGAPPDVGSSQSLNSSIPNLNLPPSRPGQPRMSPSLNNNMRAGLGSSGMPGLKTTSAEEAKQGMESNAARAEPPFSSAAAVANPSSDGSSSATFINFDNASVQKALDNLMQSGPNLLKNISMSGSNLPQNANQQTSPNVPKPGGNLPGLSGPSNDGMGMQRGNMGPRGGPGGPPDLPGSGQMRGSGSMDIGPPRGPGGMSDMGGPGSQRGPGPMSDLGGPGSQRGPGGMSDVGGPRGMSDLGGPGSQRGPGGLPDVGGPRGMSDVGGPRSMSDVGGPRGMSDVGGPRGMSELGGPGSQRGPGGDMMGMGSRGGYGGMSDMGGMNSGRGFGNAGMSDSGMGGPPRMSDMGRMGGPPPGMGPGNNFSGPNQYGRGQGGPGQQGNFGGGYNNNMGNMPRQNYGGQGMGGMGGPRRY